ncbi:MAG TPA: YkgJ family cysteine cluster protein [Pirellulaceae bacterium]|nr:YkgJ family cysteine cluster protein [Pirellulaceae bacterium]
MSSPVNQTGSESLLAELSNGGPLAQLFRQASREVRGALEKVLAGGRAAQVVEQLSQSAHASLQNGTNASPLVVLRQCGAGCSACCHTVSADITPLEAIVVAEQLLRSATAETLARVRARLHLNTVLRANMTAEERSRTRLPCGLLGDDGLCSVYESRPLVCAGVFSLSRPACEQATLPTDLTVLTVPLDRPAKAWTMGVSGGLQRALVEAGLDGNLYELNSIVLYALDIPDVAARWLRGDDVFAPCVCTDAHSPPRKPPAARRVDAPQTQVSPSALKLARKQRAKLLKKRQ